MHSGVSFTVVAHEVGLFGLDSQQNVNVVFAGIAEISLWQMFASRSWFRVDEHLLYPMLRCQDRQASHLTVQILAGLLNGRREMTPRPSPRSPTQF